jgi:hypothetical protein
VNNELANILLAHLSTSTQNVVKVQRNGVRLVISDTEKRYSFSLQDIEQKYSSIPNFLHTIAQKGFTKDVEFVLQRMYQSKGTFSYRTLQVLIEDLTHDMNTADNHEIVSSYPNSPSYPNFLGAPELMAKMVQAERSEDYKEQVQELKETVKDLRSKNRVLEEKNSSLTIKLETAKEREELRVQKELLNKKSFLETPAFEKTMETLGGILPKVIEASANNNATAQPNTALASPSLSPIKKAFVQKLSIATDEQTMFFNYLLDNWKEDLIQYVAQHIEQQENNNEEITD